MRAGVNASWVDGADGSDGFGLAHLPYGVFRDASGAPRVCVRIGKWLLDLQACADDGLLADVGPEICAACCAANLNAVMECGPAAWMLLRARITQLLREDADAALRAAVGRHLHRVAEAEMVYPLATRGYIDFYASIDHARHVGEMFRPENPLLANYRYVPIGYNGRASSLVVSGTAVQRPWGQRKPGSEAAQPEFAPTRALDYELELAFVVGQANRVGEPIPVAEARSHLFGVALLNDWSARDVQAWEYQPLGPFLGKSFATSVSAWITPMEALEPYRTAARARAEGEPQPLAYLRDEADERGGGLEVEVEVLLRTAKMRAAGEAAVISQASTRGLYWTAAQMVAHATSNGCALEVGDVLATGTISGEQRASGGCLLELTRQGSEPIRLANGETRAWLEDGDEVILEAHCRRAGFPRLTLGRCAGRIVAARESWVGR